MALQGNPFLGKLKIPAPDLSRIPETPFESQIPKPDELKSAPSPIENQDESNRFQTVSETVSIGFPSSSSLFSDNFKTTTTSEPELFESTATQLAPEWQFVDVSPLAEIGFTQSHLIQIIRQGTLKPAEVESSIEYFAFDLKRNGKAKTLRSTPLNAFMGILRKGPYGAPENYETPADEQRIKDLEFAEWRRRVPVGELARLLPEWAQKPGQIQESSLRAHFDENVWPERRAVVPGLIEQERAEIGTQIDQALGETRG